MKRKWNIPILREWIISHNPNGIEKLAVQSGVSVSTIKKLVNHRYPSVLGQITMQALCTAIGCELDHLFPYPKKRGRK